MSDHVDWEKTSKETCIEIIGHLREDLRKLQIQYDERAASMRDTADVVRSLYTGSEVSKRINWMKDKIQNAIAALKSGDSNEAIRILEQERPK